MMKFLVFYVAAALIYVSSSYGNIISPKEENSPISLCGEYVFVDDQVVLIDGPFNENCIMQFQTQEDRVLAFSVVDGNIKETRNFLTIHDGIDVNAPVLLVENQEKLLSNKDLPTTVYTTQSEAVIKFTKSSTSNFKLKIQKAVGCRFNLGIDSQCGRVVDHVSCYCATFINRNQADQTMYCIDYNMKLISFENRTEEELVQAAWGTETAFWTSLTDTRRDGTWVWESSMTVPDYTNWYPKRPNTAVSNVDDCMLYGGATYLNFWGDIICSTLAHAVCEAQP
uniref:C-type lectin domain-containing protein n=1 Tax=Daphnia galeata TaxID=27404 RepID=A0A8J2WK77_9CRUS|nr:unnamed protein product [Daphnia galeata]